MKTAENQLQQKIIVGSLIGPVMLLASLALLFMNFPEKTAVFALVAVASIVPSWRWTWRGVALSLALLSLGFAYHYPDMSRGELFWHLGLSCTLILGFVTTALASEETKENFKNLFSTLKPSAPESSESQQLKELLAIQAEKTAYTAQLEAELHASQAKFEQQQNLLASQKLFTQAAQQELQELKEEQDNLQQEAARRKESSARLQLQLAESREEWRFLKEELAVAKESHLVEILKIREDYEENQKAISKLTQQLAEKVKEGDVSLLKVQEKFALELRSSKAQLEGQTRRASFLEEEKQAIQREWQREKLETEERITAQSQELSNLETLLEAEAVRAATLQKQSEKEKLELQVIQAQLEDQTRRTSALEEEKGEVQQTMAGLQQRYQSLQTLYENAERIAAKSLAEVETLRASYEAEARELNERQKSVEFTSQTNQAQVALLQENIAVVEAQKIAHWRAMRTAEGKAQQLREQFEEKSHHLHLSRKAQFQAEELAERFRLDLEEWLTSGLHQEISPFLFHIEQMSSTHTASLAACKKEVESLENLVTHLIKEANHV